MSSLNELPPKILLRIFAYFDLNDLVSVRRVNKKFRAVADDGSLYRCVSFNRSHHLDDVIRALRRHVQHIEACNLEEITDTNTILRYASRCPKLRKLRLRECDGEKGIMETVLQSLFGATKITQLALKKCELEKFPKLNLSNVTHLSIIDNTGYQQQHLQCVPEVLSAINRNHDTLLSLRLGLDPMNADEKNQLFGYLRKCSKLKVFQFQYPYADEISEQNFQKLFNLCELVSLSVVVSSGTDTNIHQKFIDLSWLSQLRKLELGGTICRLLPQIVKRCQRLKVFRLICTSQPFFHGDSEELVSLLTSCKNLEEIELRSICVPNLRNAVLLLPHNLLKLRHLEIETTEIDKSESNSNTPVQIELNVVSNFALETQILDHSTVYFLFKSDELLKYIIP